MFREKGKNPRMYFVAWPMPSQNSTSILEKFRQSAVIMNLVISWMDMSWKLLILTFALRDILIVRRAKLTFVTISVWRAYKAHLAGGTFRETRHGISFTGVPFW